MSPLPDHHRLVFVGGLHRSGTTALARVLGAHPEVSGFTETGVKEDEGQHLQSVYPPARDYGGAGRFAFDERSHLTESSVLATEEQADRLFAQWAPHWDLSKPVLVEKSPPNLVMTRFLQALAPDARFVIITRHPVVVALSTQKWRRGQALARSVQHWVRAHEIFLADLPFLKHVRVLRYEDLVTDPRRVLNGVQEFLGLHSPLPSDSIRADRSADYTMRWAQLAGSRSPVRRAAVARVARAFAPAAAFGYQIPALDELTPGSKALQGVLI